MTMFDANTIQALSTIRDYIRLAFSTFSQHELFYGHGSDNAWDEAVYLVAGTLNLPWDFDKDLMNAHLTLEERALIIERIQTRIQQRMPLPYLLGEAWFCEMPFTVSPDVLIPRSPIAELIQNDFQPWLSREPSRILDLCTGSGCIGIACAAQFPDAEVELSDISVQALQIAERNIQRHHLSERVRAVQSDLFLNLSGRYDLIVSNPPYVDANDLATMPQEYHAEPSLALAAGDDGLHIAHSILAHARDYLNDDGLLVVEVGNSWEALELHYEQVPFTWLEFENGGHGVFVMTADELDRYSEQLTSARGVSRRP